MILTETLHAIATAQRMNLVERDSGLTREILPDLRLSDTHALILTGIRRCGKSTLLHQLLKRDAPNALFLNFEDPRLFDFELDDFVRLDAMVEQTGLNTMFLDEVQVIPGWETYARRKLDEGTRMVITGSNATMLSSELGTKLTGRHRSKEVFPFSFREFLLFQGAESTPEAALDYMKTGGFPEHVKQGDQELLQQLFEDLLLRDVASRHGIRDTTSLQRLALHLVSNVGKRVTANRLKSLFGIGATSTVMEYFSHLEQAWLFHFIPKFSYSVRKQMINPRKVYAIDTGLINATSRSFTSDLGPLFENLVFLHLRRQTREIYYFSDKNECDFVVHHPQKPPQLVQACFDLTQDALPREVGGLLEAMAYLKVQEGWIVTAKQNDRLIQEGKTIHVISLERFLLD